MATAGAKITGLTEHAALPAPTVGRKDVQEIVGNHSGPWQHARLRINAKGKAIAGNAPVFRIGCYFL